VVVEVALAVEDVYVQAKVIHMNLRILIVVQARKSNGEADAAAPNGTGPTNVPGQAAGLTTTTNEALTAEAGEDGIDLTKPGKTNAKQPRKQRGPPEDGIPSKNKIMVANLPYDLREEKVCYIISGCA